jgi:hypothetical protein
VVRLWETTAAESGEYVALSHCWGPPPHFMTTRTNIQEYIAGIELNKLPPTFRDAVLTTRALRVPYLWIDSLCIIQGSDGDFQQEAKRMESVYSNAYCVIAVSCTTSAQYNGFLGLRRPERDYVTLQDNNGEDFFVCANIDDFQTHVLDGELSTRGWVLQEHALARRTLFFTDHQMYWECGDGVRCETLTKMEK